MRDGSKARVCECSKRARALRLRLLVALCFVMLGVPFGAAACKKTSAATPAQCEEIRMAAASSALAAVSAAASSCITTSDCGEIGHVSCDYGCSGYAVANGHRSEAERAIAKIDGEKCKQWRERDCAKIAPLPIASCASPSVACRKNRCEMRYPWQKLSAEKCNALIAEGDEEIAATIDGAERTCTNDADCMVVSNHACFPDCGGRPIAVRSFDAYQAANKRVLDGQCKEWHDGDCMTTAPHAAPSCMSVRPKCLKSKIAQPLASRYPPGHCIVER